MKSGFRHKVLIFLLGSGLLFCAAGRELTLKIIQTTDLHGYIAEFAPYEERCRFDNCTHLTEPDCAVKDAVARGDIDPSRYASYKMMLEEVAKWQK